ncbi:winged helix-turn-helix transcriptional regulator [Staphylococcus aureus]|nr:winged helix-turn-helix transcriptional regulator [Staphylococcus aureus]MCA2198037.1 winged helix-turn-helix transcriptional regulator [Staphylococcus aureus]MCA5591630.1 winged helix-turn-helix transcriptional regulator [Staphylococcus aureus]MDI1510581.1 winged helix-turn-helix transcriptional regulator [Staphylococcus aureus]MDI1559555.1 winged helix-turn-helix transcriptional regulator [Staphylococcus aureus]MDI1600791.1 winged helix-turn-helix transcriptional regulator [Staphylococcus
MYILIQSFMYIFILTFTSKQVNLSAPAVRERVNKLEEQGIIQGYTINIDYKQLGYDVEKLIELTIKNNRYSHMGRQNVSLSFHQLSKLHGKSLISIGKIFNRKK